MDCLFSFKFLCSSSGCCSMNPLGCSSILSLETGGLLCSFPFSLCSSWLFGPAASLVPALALPAALQQLGHLASLGESSLLWLGWTDWSELQLCLSSDLPWTMGGLNKHSIGEAKLGAGTSQLEELQPPWPGARAFSLLCFTDNCCRLLPMYR